MSVFVSKPAFTKHHNISLYIVSVFPQKVIFIYHWQGIDNYFNIFSDWEPAEVTGTTVGTPDLSVMCQRRGVWLQYDANRNIRTSKQLVRKHTRTLYWNQLILKMDGAGGSSPYHESDEGLLMLTLISYYILLMKRKITHFQPRSDRVGYCSIRWKVLILVKRLFVQ